jgi:hypothetical protein
VPIEEAEAEVVRQIFAWDTGVEKLTMGQITERLNHSATPALRRTQTWQFSIVHKILKRTAYIGRTYFNRERRNPRDAAHHRAGAAAGRSSGTSPPGSVD